ncbi:MAG: glutamine synthetase [Pseudomonadaceae bacterium]|nr:glutamine synthetase [Pseudomonadaceae bacterium]
MKTIEELKALVTPESNAKVGVVDMDGVLRGKYLSSTKFAKALDDGFGFCDVVLGWDSADELYDNTSYTGWHSAYPDAHVRLLPETARLMPMEAGMPFVLGEFTGSAEAVCPRATLRRVLERGKELGFQVKAGSEFEFFLFNETPQSVRDKGYRQLEPLTPGMFGYSVLRSSVNAEIFHDLMDLCREMDFELEGLHTETGPGVLEAAIAYDDALDAADKAALFKTFTKVWAQRNELMATFMARWSTDYPGQSGHLHLSLLDNSGDNAFFDANDSHGMSDVMRWFIGGQQALMPELLAMIAPNVNSFARLVPGMWAPTSATWGIDNRTCALRVIEGGDRGQRVEFRVAAADINPYLALAAAIGAGIWGIENRLEPDAPITGNAYEKRLPARLRLPSNLAEATRNLARSKAGISLFGEAFVQHYCASREWEARQFDQAVTSWELERYFEII